MNKLNQTKILFITLNIVATEIQGGNLKSYYEVEESQSENPETVRFQEHGSLGKASKDVRGRQDWVGLWIAEHRFLRAMKLSRDITVLYPGCVALGIKASSPWTCSKDHVSVGSHGFQQVKGTGQIFLNTFTVMENFSRIPKSVYFFKKVSQMPLLYEKYSFFSVLEQGLRKPRLIYLKLSFPCIQGWPWISDPHSSTSPIAEIMDLYLRL